MVAAGGGAIDTGLGATGGVEEIIDRPMRLVGVDLTGVASMVLGSIPGVALDTGAAGGIETVSTCDGADDVSEVDGRTLLGLTVVAGASGAATAVAVPDSEEPSSSSPLAFFFVVARERLLLTFSTSTCSVVSMAVPVPAVLNHSLMVASSPGPTVDMCALILGTPSAMHLSTIALLSMPSSFAIWEIRLAKFNSRTNHRLNPIFDTPTILRFGLRGPSSFSRSTHAPRIRDA